MDFWIARIDPSHGGGIIETREKLWDFGKNKYSNLVPRTSQTDDFLELPRILYRICSSSGNYPRYSLISMKKNMNCPVPEAVRLIR